MTAHTAIDETTVQRFDSLMDPPRRVALREAVRQRIALHPQARTHDVVAMLEFAGIQAPFELVQEIMEEERSPHPAGAGLVHAPPALQCPSDDSDMA
jgi:hypothetical protein